jgi:excisionase family DNA binding protein
MYSVKEASAKLGISERRVTQLLTQGRINGKRLGRDWVVLDLNYQRKRKPKTKKGETNERS